VSEASRSRSTSPQEIHTQEEEPSKESTLDGQLRAETYQKDGSGNPLNPTTNRKKSKAVS
jgi:hypothetical protein